MYFHKAPRKAYFKNIQNEISKEKLKSILQSMPRYK